MFLISEVALYIIHRAGAQRGAVSVYERGRTLDHSHEVRSRQCTSLKTCELESPPSTTSFPWVCGLAFRVWSSGFRVQGLGFRVRGSGFEACSNPPPALLAFPVYMGTSLMRNCPPQ